MNEVIMNAAEIIGTAAFSVSGALIAICCGLDLFGVVFIGVITAVGGGIVRDIILGNCPPAFFSNIYTFVIAAVTSIVVFILSYINRKHFEGMKERIEKINNVFDAIGLSAFSVRGAEIAFEAGFRGNIILVVLMGMITGVGGGLFRDVLVDKTPYVLKKHIYALASLAGSLIYYIERVYIGSDVAGCICAMSVVFVIRMLATRYRWKLPKVRMECAKTEEKI